MNIKPILFNTEMVRAIVDGRKTTTRRIIKPQPQADADMMFCFAGSCNKDIRRWHDRKNDARFTPPCCGDDILWVRETWQHGYIETSDAPGSNEQWFEESTKNDGDYIKALSGYFYRSDFTDGEAGIADICWRPSIHMPREAARLFLRVTSIRAERLQGITEEEARAEGVPDEWPMDPVYCPICKGEGLIGSLHPVSLGYMEIDCPHCERATDRFKNLWDSTIKPADRDRYGWEANPWVWVIEFERCEKPKELCKGEADGN